MQANTRADEAEGVAREHFEAERAALEKEADDVKLRAEVERLRAMEALREEHHKALEREKEQAERWIQDVKEGFKAEKQHLDEKVKALEETATTRGRRTDDVGGDSDGTVHVPEASHAADMEGGVDGDDPGTVDDSTTRAVSYTHLTLPTIYPV